MIATISKAKQTATKSYKFCKALSAIEELTHEELITLKKELEKKASKKRMLLQSNQSDEHSFFLFGKWPDFENAETLRKKAWKRNFI